MWQREAATQPIERSTTTWRYNWNTDTGIHTHIVEMFEIYLYICLELSTDWHESNPGVFLTHVHISKRDLLCIVKLWMTRRAFSCRYFSVWTVRVWARKASWQVQLNAFCPGAPTQWWGCCVCAPWGQEGEAQISLKRCRAGPASSLDQPDCKIGLKHNFMKYQREE